MTGFKNNGKLKLLIIVGLRPERTAASWME